MNAFEIQAGEIEVLELKPADDDSFGIRFPLKMEVALYRVETTGEILLKMRDQVWSVRGIDSRNDEILANLVDCPCLCWLAGAFPRQGNAATLVVQVHRFGLRHRSPDPIKMGIDDKIVEDIRRQWIRNQQSQSVEEVLRWLTESTLLNSATVQRALISADPSSGPGTWASFRIHGSRVALDVKNLPDIGYQVTRVISSSARNEQHRMIFLVEGQFSYHDATAVGQFREAGRTLLDSIVLQAGSYLSLWKEYNRLESMGIRRRAWDFGWLWYSRCEQLPDGQWRFWVNRDEHTIRAFDTLQDQVEVDLEVAEDLPPELSVEPDDEGDRLADRVSDEQGTPVFAGQCTAVNTANRTLDLRPLDLERDDEAPRKGVIYLSLTGDRVRLNRRGQARQRIEGASNPMPWLGLLLEQHPYQANRRTHRIRVKKSDILEFFGGEPTPRQMQALEMALNTPDIALIQGPPGTGKTRVIAALEKKLADESQNSRVAGQTLLTSYQHDAVEHAADRTLVLGLPAIKVGHRHGSTKAYDSYDSVETWRQEQLDAVSAQLSLYPSPPAQYTLRQVQTQVAGYLQQPGTPADVGELLHRIYESTLGLIPSELSDRLAELEQQMYHPLSKGSEERELILRAARALRTSPGSFSDDGPRTAYKLQRRLQDKALLTNTELAQLEQAMMWDEGDDLDFLPVLRTLKEKLLDELGDDPTLDRNHLINVDIESALTEVIDALYHHVRQRMQPTEVALYDYLDDLRNNPHGVRATLQDYTAVLAATCQQSVSRSMEKLKGESGIRFQTVIVDEAARANPLDLLIPLARAERRIILVGDHRQLPHILEPDVERQIESSKVSTQEALSKSLFERLFKHAQELERRDGIKRSISLDAQYRMHPALGRFVSQTFYETHGERFTSPRLASEFEHNLERYEGKAAAWVDIPLHAGREKKGRSKSRPVEAHWVAREAHRILDQQPDQSVGVITFYKDQLREIQREMLQLGLLVETDSGVEVARAYRETRTTDGQLIERLRIGTVDAFQGKEFDVVLLSLTRSNSVKLKDLTSQRRKYGFLTLENRLCVAMSRQKRLLIIVGDVGMVLEPGAEQAIPGLKAFYELCGGEHGIRLSS